MMQSDADRLVMIKESDGQLVRVPNGEFWAIFDKQTADVFADPAVESRQPELSSCRTSDVERLVLTKDDAVELGRETYRVKKIEDDGTGMSRVLLKK